MGNMRNSLVAAVIFVSLFAGPADFRTSAQSRTRVNGAGELRPSGVIRPQAVASALPLPCQTSTAITSGTPANGTLSGTDCTVTAGKYIDLYSFSGTSGQVVNISLTSAAFDAYLYLYDSSGTVIMENDDSGTGQDARIPPDLGVIVLPTTGTYYIGASSLSAGSTGGYTVTLSGDTSCAATSVTPSATVNASIATTDCKVSGGGLVYYTKLYSFSGTSGQKIAITMSSSAFDSYLILPTPSGAGTVEDDDGGGDPTARIPVTSGFLTLAETGTYIIEATAFDPLQTG
ncbi:MAG: PPC domain-containing protein, partial [Acidobacteriota bacterium]